MPRPKKKNKKTPLHHVGRIDWQDDRDLIEDIAASIDRPGSNYDRYQPGVRAFREWVHQFRKKGYDKSQEAAQIGGWLRELLAEKKRREGKYDLNTRPLFIPDDLTEVIRIRQTKEEEEEIEETVDLPPTFREVLTNDRTRNLAKKRAEELHEGDLGAYLSSLVEKERHLMESPSWSTIDLLDACRYQLLRVGLEFKENYVVNETDFWVPKLALGVETTVEWDKDKEEKVLGVIGETKFRLKAQHFAIVVRNDMREHQLDAMRKIEKRKTFENLKVLKIDQFGPHLKGIIAGPTITRVHKP